MALAPPVSTHIPVAEPPDQDRDSVHERYTVSSGGDSVDRAEHAIANHLTEAIGMARMIAGAEFVEREHLNRLYMTRAW
jgi:hypothetical protein